MTEPKPDVPETPVRPADRHQCPLEPYSWLIVPPDWSRGFNYDALRDHVWAGEDDE